MAEFRENAQRPTDINEMVIKLPKVLINDEEVEMEQLNLMSRKVTDLELKYMKFQRNKYKSDLEPYRQFMLNTHGYLMYEDPQHLSPQMRELYEDFKIWISDVFDEEYEKIQYKVQQVLLGPRQSQVLKTSFK